MSFADVDTTYLIILPEQANPRALETGNANTAGCADRGGRADMVMERRTKERRDSSSDSRRHPPSGPPPRCQTERSSRCLPCESTEASFTYSLSLDKDTDHDENDDGFFGGVCFAPSLFLFTPVRSPVALHKFLAVSPHSLCIAYLPSSLPVYTPTPPVTIS